LAPISISIAVARRRWRITVGSCLTWLRTSTVFAPETASFIAVTL
jgi:hypothetical protein